MSKRRAKWIAGILAFAVMSIVWGFDETENIV